MIKKIIVFFTIMLLIISTSVFNGCFKKETVANNTVKPIDTKIKSIDQQNKIMEDFKNLTKSAKSEINIIKYVNENIEFVSSNNADDLVCGIYDIQSKNYSNVVDTFIDDDKLNNKIIKEFEYDFDITMLDKVKDVELKKSLTDLLNSGYKILSEEGMYYPIINYSFYKKYSKYLTADFNDYIKLTSLESDIVPTLDAGLVISFDEVFKRAKNYEDFILKYPSFKKLSEVKERYKFYIKAYILGTDNTPVFEYSTKEMVETAKQSYLSLTFDDKNSILLSNLKDYIPILQRNNFKLTKEVDNNRKIMIINIENKL